MKFTLSVILLLFASMAGAWPPSSARGEYPQGIHAALQTHVASQIQTEVLRLEYARIDTGAVCRDERPQASMPEFRLHSQPPEDVRPLLVARHRPSIIRGEESLWPRMQVQ